MKNPYVAASFLLGILLIFILWLWKTAPVLVIFGAIALALWILKIYTEIRRDSKARDARIAAMTPEELVVELERKRENELLFLYGPINQHLVCPHCQTKGLVRAKQKVLNTVTTGHVGGILKANTNTTTTSTVTQHHCCQCKTTWDI